MKHCYATIDLSALRNNIQQIRQRAPDSKIMAMLKADAYGHGSLQVLAAMDEVDAIAVAHLQEALAIRQVGNHQPILVLQGFSDHQQLTTFAEQQFITGLHNLEQLEILKNSHLTQTIKVWVKLDTGMHRLGFLPEQLPTVMQTLSNLSQVQQPITLFSHFADADDPIRVKTQQQIHCFETVTDSYHVPKSLANSAGVLAFPQAHADWVRPGIILYGVSPFADSYAREWGFKPVMSLYSKVIAVKTIPAGDSVGYGSTWQAARQTRLATVAIGYGDGYPRHIQSGAPVLINEQRAAIVGRISMDMLSVDVTDIDVQVGDKVTLWGDGLPIEEIASYADTIPYQLLCNLTPRVERRVC